MKRGVIVLEKEIYYSVSVIKLMLGWVGFGLVCEEKSVGKGLLK